MKKILKLRLMLLIASAVVATVAVGCSSSYEDQPTPGVIPDESLDEDDGVAATFNFDVVNPTYATGEDGDAKAGNTRVTEENDAVINDLWILQYDDSGKLVRRKYITSQDILTAESFRLTLYHSAKKIAFFTNAGSDFGTSDATRTFQVLEKVYLDIVAHDDVLVDDYWYMSGLLLLEDISLTEINEVKLRRNVARVTVKIENNLDPDRFELKSIETINIQDKSFFFPGDYSSATTFPATSSTIDYEWSTEDVTAGTGDDGLTFYLPINKRGTVESNDTVSDKSKNALADATAIRVYFHRKGTNFQQIIYTFYLGADMIDDYNILGNNIYNYTFTLDGLGVADSRVESEYYTINEEDVSNCYIINPNSVGEATIYIPIEGRINTFWGDQGYENVEDNRLLRGDDWEVDILWSDISEHIGSTSSPTSSVGFFTAERVVTSASTLTPRGNAIEGSTALKISLSRDLYNNSTYHGNIIVGIRNTDYSPNHDNYLWSWHFWITNYSPDGPVSGGSILPGGATTESVPNGDRIALPDDDVAGNKIWSGAYSGKWMMDRPIGAITATPTLHDQNRGVLYYQFGRKDPFSLWPAGTYTTSNISSKKMDVGTIKNGVLNPTKFDVNNNQGVTGSDPTYQNTTYVWNDKLKPHADKGDSPTDVGGKSIFDPSPLGWKVPARKTWTYMIGTRVSGDANTSGSTGDYCYNQGSYFGASGATNSSNYFAYYPGSGNIAESSGEIKNSGAYGYYWSCSPGSDSYGYYLYFGTGDTISPEANYLRGNARAIVPVQE